MICLFLPDFLNLEMTKWAAEALLVAGYCSTWLERCLSFKMTSLLTDLYFGSHCKNTSVKCSIAYDLTSQSHGHDLINLRAAVQNKHQNAEERDLKRRWTWWAWWLVPDGLQFWSFHSWSSGVFKTIARVSTRSVPKRENAHCAEVVCWKMCCWCQRSTFRIGRLFRSRTEKKNKLVVTDVCRIASLNTQDPQGREALRPLNSVAGRSKVYLRKCPVVVYVRVTILKWSLS